MSLNRYSRAIAHPSIYSHKISVVLKLHDRLEDQSPSVHPQQTAGVLGVGKHSACGENITAITGGSA